MYDTQASLRKFIAGTEASIAFDAKDASPEEVKALAADLGDLDPLMFSATFAPGRVVITRLRKHGAHVFSGPTDARQAASGEAVVPTVFRPRYRALTESEKQLHDAIKMQADELLRLYNMIGNPGRYRALAQTALEESVMWAVKELTK